MKLARCSGGGGLKMPAMASWYVMACTRREFPGSLSLSLAHPLQRQGACAFIKVRCSFDDSPGSSFIKTVSATVSPVVLTALYTCSPTLEAQGEIA